MKADVVVIGSGIGGLCCGALLAKYGFDVVVCESHAIAGGAAHGFERQGYRFDSGPSLYSGLSVTPSANPLKQVLDAIEVTLPCLQYDTWGCCLPEGSFETAVGGDQFCEVLARLRGDRAVQEWRTLQQVMDPLKEAAVALPPAALRWDWRAIQTIGQFAPQLWRHGRQMTRLSGAFQPLIADIITDPFIQNWLNLLCFLLSGLPAADTSAAEVAFMFADWYRPNVALDYPVGGSAGLVNALVQGLQKQGGQLWLNAHVEQILIAGGRAIGVQLRDGRQIQTTRAVVSNASIWDTLRLLPAGSIPETFRQRRQATPTCDSFMHLHLGIEASGLPADLNCHYIVVNDWEQGITAPQNVGLISIPSVLDPSLAPPGQHAIHVYTPGNEPYSLWEGLDRRSAAYHQQKQARSEAMWRALERIMPDIRQRCQLTLVGTPLTHERFLRRHRGSYGPALSAAAGMFPTGRMPVARLFCCGDSTFPGIGLPAVAASGMIVANTLAPIDRHQAMLRQIGVLA